MSQPCLAVLIRGKPDCPGGREAEWWVAGVRCCTPCLSTTIKAALMRFGDYKVNVWTLSGWNHHTESQPRD